MSTDHQQTVSAEFAKQAGDFGRAGLTLSSVELLDWAVANLPHARAQETLDVATGTGHLARALAPHVHSVTGIDATPEMLAQGIAATRAQGIDNIRNVRGLAEALPFADGRFDLSVCRLAVHHYQRPDRHVREMARVCKPGGAVALVDLTAPADRDLAEQYNHYERLRDPSHTEAQTIEALVALLEGEGVTVNHVASREVTVVVEPWLALTRTPQDRAETVRRALIAELDGGPASGMRPFVEDGELKFLHTWVVVSGTTRG